MKLYLEPVFYYEYQKLWIRCSKIIFADRDMIAFENSPFLQYTNINGWNFGSHNEKRLVQL